MSDQEAPRTGEEAVDQAVSGLEELDQRPLAEHHDQLARAHEQLHAVLSRDDHPTHHP